MHLVLIISYINCILLVIEIYKWLITAIQAGVAKSIVRVVRVVHLLLRTSNFFQLTCPWTSENILYLCVFIENYSSRNRKYTNFSLFFSSPEHKVLRVSYCDRPLSVVRRRPSCVVRRA